MEKRKIVRSGLFSYTISLPKEWLARFKLDKGNEVSIEEYGDDLIIRPGKADHKSNSKNHESCVFDVDKFSTSTVIRDITSAYLTNVKTITLEGSSLKNTIESYKKAINSYPGLEVIEETGNSLVLKNLINVDEFIIQDLLSRSDIILRSMFSDILESMKTKDEKLAESVVQRDKEINRLTFLVCLCLNHINEYPQEAKIHGVEVALSPNVWEINSDFEKIGDELKRFARLIPEFRKQKTARNKIISIFGQIEDFYLDVMFSFYKNDLEKADNSSLKRKGVLSLCNDFLLTSRSPNLRGMASRMIYLISFINSISRISRYITFGKHSIVKGKLFLSKKGDVHQN